MNFKKHILKTISAIIAAFIVTLQPCTDKISVESAEQTDYENTYCEETIKLQTRTFKSADLPKTAHTAVLAMPEKKDIKLSAVPVSVNTIVIEYDTSLSSSITVTPADEDFEYIKNISYKRVDNNEWYVTGLRENKEYTVTVYTQEDIYVTTVCTEAVNVTKEYEHEDGETCYFAYEHAGGLTRNPSKSAISEAFCDPITDTGIMRNCYGDYCVAMGLFYGQCEDRFLVELENGTQFTAMICDSKGYASDGQGKYHIFGNTGKCIIEFIYADGHLPPEVRKSGTYGNFSFYGLKFNKSNIKSIKKIAYPDHECLNIR